MKKVKFVNSSTNLVSHLVNAFVGHITGYKSELSLRKKLLERTNFKNCFNIEKLLKCLNTLRTDALSLTSAADNFLATSQEL